MGEWRTDSWGPCTHSCGTLGIQYRILQCVWVGTRKPAGNSCDSNDRPGLHRPCADMVACPRSNAISQQDALGNKQLVINNGGPLGPLPPVDWRGWKDLSAQRNGAPLAPKQHDSQQFWRLLYRDKN